MCKKNIVPIVTLRLEGQIPEHSTLYNRWCTNPDLRRVLFIKKQTFWAHKTLECQFITRVFDTFSTFIVGVGMVTQPFLSHHRDTIYYQKSYHLHFHIPGLWSRLHKHKFAIRASHHTLLRNCLLFGTPGCEDYL